MKLSNQNINDAIEEIQKFFDSLNVPRKDKIRISLLLEEALLRYQEKFGEDYEFKLIVKKWFGTPKVLIKIKGTPYNPIEDNNKEQLFSEMMMKTLMSYEQAGISYRYENGCNEIRVLSTKETEKLKIPGGSTTIAVFLAIFFALIVQNFSEPTQKIIVENVMTPILDTLFGVIIAINIPFIFISIVASICAIENVTILNEISTKILLRFLAILSFVSFSSILISEIFFPVINLNFGEQVLSGNSNEWGKIFDLILSIIPRNIIAPFYEGKILQIVALAVLMGICITILGEKVKDLKPLIIDLKLIIFEMVTIVFKVIPAIIFLCIFKTILQSSISEVFTVWKLILTEYVLFIGLSLIMLWRNSFNHGVKILDFIKKIYPAILITFTTSSGSAAMPKNIELCKKELKISKTLCDFYIPLSHALCPSAMLIGFVTATFFAAHFSGEQITIAEIFIIAFLAIQFAISASSGNGGMVAMLGLMLTQLGIPLDAIGTIMIADIFVVNVSGIVTLIIRDCDLLDLAYQNTTA
ncbi:MAG: cation:dicarboxylase symporter family transporter [Selenomonadaceae bacterium]|nr:cation:dicarboxylase symporter family transporter [Selenomonadaceae bacterium]